MTADGIAEGGTEALGTCTKFKLKILPRYMISAKQILREYFGELAKH